LSFPLKTHRPKTNIKDPPPNRKRRKCMKR
jgi:hypothetical protein